MKVFQSTCCWSHPTSVGNGMFVPGVMTERTRRRGGWKPAWAFSSPLLMLLLLLIALAYPLGAAEAALSTSLRSLPPPCDSLIYCHGDLLKTVQMAGLYNDSKYFVDMPLQHSPNETLLDFQSLMDETSGKPSKEQVQAFVNRNFREPGSEFEPWTPDDWNPNPEFLEEVIDPALQEWGHDLNELWKFLGRKISEKVSQEPEKYSQIYVSHPVVVPGGRFREFYYWDSYWTIDGLLLCGMNETVKGMLKNFLQMVDTYGMVPNGGRNYYTQRSQPPYLIPMFQLYMEYTNDIDFLRESIDRLEKEFLFWETERSVNVTDSKGKTHTVAQYRVEAADPRPESFREDYELAHNLTSEDAKQQLYIELKSGAESGWDYSTRWIVNNDTNHGTLKDLKVTSIAPVDLNSLLCMNARILSEFYRKAGNYSKEKYYEDLANSKNATMAEFFWDNSDGTWYDFDITKQQKRRYFYLSNIHPIWSDCYGKEGSRAHTIEKVITYLKHVKVLNYVGGMPTSLEHSGLQWDFPNAWAPLQHIAILGLYKARSIHHEAESLSFSLAEKWVRTNWLAYQQSSPHAMFEKYNVELMGLPGGGGEYSVQLGFGWTNGVAMQLLDIFGDRLTAVRGGSASFRAPSLMAVLSLVFMPYILRNLSASSV